MGQYKFSIYTNWQIGLIIRIEDYSIEISIPFITMYIGLRKDARGFNFFNINN